jgi:hypothetical protein
LKENFNLIHVLPSFLDGSSLSLTDRDKFFIYSLIPSEIQLTKVFSNGDFKQYKKAVEKKKAVLIICKTSKTSFGLLIVDIIIFGKKNSSSLICAFNIEQRKLFKGNGKVEAWDEWAEGSIEIGMEELVILVHGKGNYSAYSNSSKDVLNITNEINQINTIT